MRIGKILLGLTLLVSVVYGVFLMLGDSPPATTPAGEAAGASGRTATDHAGHDHDHDHQHDGDEPHEPGHHKMPVLGYFPKVSATGPWPKVVLSRLELDFDRTEVGERRDLMLEVRNEGDGELEFSQGDTTCECTISEFTSTRVPPHGSVTIPVRWNPTMTSSTHESTMDLRTNDPDQKTIQLKIVGMAVKRFMLMPELDWPVSKVSETEPTVVTGYVTSAIVNGLAPMKLEYDESRMDVKVVPLSEQAVEATRARSGFGLEVSLKPGMPIGAFQFPLKVITNTPDRGIDGELGDPAVLTANIVGRRDGPFRILGAAYLVREGIVVMDSFSANDGKTVPLTILVRDAPEEGLKFTEVDSDPAYLTATIEPDAKDSGVAKRYKVQLAFPPGSPRAIRRDANPALIKIKTNHATAPELEFRVHFTAY